MSMAGGILPATQVIPGSASLHPEATPQTYLTASAGELSNGESIGDYGYNAGGSPSAPLVFATTATAGAPGTWNGDAPNTVADLIAGKPNTVTASPATAWTTGQYVQTETAGNPGKANWTGSAWVAGTHA